MKGLTHQGFDPRFGKDVKKRSGVIILKRVNDLILQVFGVACFSESTYSSAELKE